MRQIAAALILAALFITLVGSRFQPSDGDHLAAISRLASTRIREALPLADRIARPINALKHELPERIEDRVKSRLDTDKRLAGIEFTVTAEGAVVKLQGIVPDTATRKRILAIAENTIGVESVVDELAVPE